MQLMTKKEGSEVQKQEKTDLELVCLTLQDADFFGQIIERYEKKLMRYVLYFTGLGPDAAADILQEALIKVYRNLNGFNQSLSFSSWIYRIVHNEAVNYLRKNSNRQVVSLETDDEEAASLIDILQSEDDVVQIVDKRKLVEQVKEVLKLMREDYREILVLKYLEDYDYNEISDILKKPLGTVGVLLSRAKENFKQTAQKLKISF